MFCGYFAFLSMEIIEIKCVVKINFMIKIWSIKLQTTSYRDVKLLIWKFYDMIKINFVKIHDSLDMKTKIDKNIEYLRLNII